jgi:periplasmic iron binding protein
MTKMMRMLQGIVGLVVVSSLAVLASAEEFAIGKPIEKHGMEIAAVYIEPAVSQDDYWGGVPLEEGATIHLEADIHATKGNRHGFGAGDWIPYLAVEYTLRNLETGEVRNGSLWQMAATDGPHYGVNLKLMPGRYMLIYTIYPPSTGGLGRHTDTETGIPEWWDVFTVEYTFDYQRSRQ